MRGHSRFVSVELPVQPGFTGPKINFTDTQTAILRSDGEKEAVIYSITTYHNVSLPLTVNGNIVATPAQVQNAFLTLYIFGTEAMMQFSMQRFLAQQNGAANDWNAREYFETAPLRVDWTNSFVELAAPGTAETAAYSFVFEFEYEWLPIGSMGKYLQSRNNKWAAGILH